MKRTSSHPDADQGTVLPLVLVVMVVLGAIVLAIASYGTANLRYAQTTERRSEQLAAADAAMSYAINLIKINRADCIFVSNATVALPPLADSFNGATGSVTCEPRYGGLDNAGLFAVALTGEGITDGNGHASTYLVNTQGGSNAKIFKGPVFMESAHPFDAAFDLANGAGIQIEGSPLVHYDHESPCEVVGKSTMVDVTFVPNIFGPLCTTQHWYEYGENGETFDEPPIARLDSGGSFDPLSTSTPNGLTLRDGAADTLAAVRWPGTFPVSASAPGDFTDVQPAFTDVGNCRVFSPGRYLTPPDTVGIDSVYFRSGDYVFDFRNPADMTFTTLDEIDFAADHDDARMRVRQSHIVAGKLDPSIPGITPTVALHADCGPVIAADPGYGATFFMSGLAHLEVETQGQIEIMPRDQAVGPDEVRYVAIHALCNTESSTWCVRGNPPSAPAQYSGLASWLTAPSGPNNPGIVYTQSGVNREMVANGLIYAPLAELELSNVTGSAQMRFRGGMVLARATLQASTSAENFEIGVTLQDVDIGFRLVATGTDVDGGTTQISSLVEYHFGEPYQDAVTVQSWRVCEDTC